MKAFIHSPNRMRISIGLALGVVLLFAGLAPALAAPGPITGISCTPGCDLYATTGSLSLPDGSTVPIWGYSTSNTPGSASLPGPLIIANQGDSLNITLHNIDLPSATSLMIAGQPLVPDTTGVTSGNSKTYTFVANNPGTFLYEAGLTADGPRQVAMGLYGALAVRPAGAPFQAYTTANTTFNDEAVLVLSEIDPAFNVAPATYDMTTFAPKYWLINGKGYPNTDPIASAPGNTVLLRYVNAGLQHHSMAVLGLHQTVIANDAMPETNPLKVVAETIPTGGTMDTLVTMPANPPANAKFVLFEAAEHIDNKGASTGGMINFGGMLTFLTTAGTTSTAGPVTSNVSLTPNPSNTSTVVTLTASISGAPDQAEYFVDTTGADSAGCQISGSLTNVSTTIPVSGANAPCADLTTLSSGNHTFYVHGHDANGWGAFASAALNLDKTGPLATSLNLTPAHTNGSADVALQATGSDVATGNQNVTAAEYFIDNQPANTVRGAAMTLNNAAPSVSLNATIPAATVASLSEGSHTIAVRALDALGNWGAFGTITLFVDKTGPTAGPVTAIPNPNNGTLGVQLTSGGAFYERIDSTVSDPAPGSSNIVAAEYFIDTVGANGAGGSMFAKDGNFSSTSEAVYAAADLYGINALSQGLHTIYSHGKDAAGNWGATNTGTLVIDKTSPAISGLATTPNPANLAAAITLNITAADPANNGTPANAPASNITSGEYFWGATDPGKGLGTAFTFATPAPSGTFSVTVDVSQRTIFTNNALSVRVKDAAGNWSTVMTTPVTIDRIFANSFPTSAAPYGWSATGGTAARLSLNAGANMKDTGTNSLAANVATGASGYVAYTLPTAQSNVDARFYVNPNAAALGNNNTPTIFAAMNGTTTVFQVQMRLSGGNYQVRVLGSGTNNNWVTITGPTAIEVVRTGTSVKLYVGAGATANQTVTVSTTGVAAFRLGLSAGVTTAMNGSTIYFDGFVASRTTRVGP